MYNRLAKLLTIISVIFGCMIVPVSARNPTLKGATPCTSNEHQSLCCFLEILEELPVDVLQYLCLATDKLQPELSEELTNDNFHPFFLTVEYEEKPSCNQLFSVPLTSFKCLNQLFSYEKGCKYLAEKKLVRFTQHKLCSRLLEEYSDGYTFITIKGMLNDLRQRSKDNDPVANLILEFLNEPYAYISLAEIQTKVSFFSRVKKRARATFSFRPKNPSFSERLQRALHLAQSKKMEKDGYFNRVALLKEDYSYEHSHTFIFHQLNSDGTVNSYLSGHQAYCDKEAGDDVGSAKINSAIYNSSG